jgi:hypothetical protein
VRVCQPLQHVAAEMLVLTKMSWNNTQFDNGLPITIAAARHVSEVLKYEWCRNCPEIQLLHVSRRQRRSCCSKP